ncbi:MAG: tetratricopeptide repeat protein [Ignavibacteriae bacterium]|nr:tetratricopeptide repeat protein [Ignavibacteriota bacterium]
MAFDSKLSDYELERDKLFEEIRKRAEVAELARIEAEELRLNLPDLNPVPAPTELPPLSQPASHIFALEPEPEKPARELKTAREIEERIESANRYYQNEQYVKALDVLDEILESRPDHTVARALRAEVERAKALSDRMLADELRSREGDQAKSLIEMPMPELSSPRTRDIGREDVLQEVPTPVASESETPQPMSRNDWKLRLRRAALGVLALFGVITGFVLYRNFYELFPGEATTVLILPARSVTLDRTQIEGLTIELIQQLSHIQALRVFAPTTALGLTHPGISSARTLDAKYMLEWSAEKSDAQSTFSYKLVDVATSRSVLENSNTVSHAEFSSFSREIVRKSREFFSVNSNSPESDLSSHNVQHEAYDLYLRSLSLLKSPNANLDSARACLLKSIALDPEFSSAEVALGLTSILQCERSSTNSQNLIEDANRHLLRALNLGNKSAAAFQLWGNVEYHRGNFPAAIQRLEQSKALASGDAETNSRLALAYLRATRSEDAIAAAAEGAKSDPLNSAARELLGMLYLLENKNTAALEEFEQKPKPSSDAYSNPYVTTLVEANRHERALDILKTYVMNNPGDFIALYDLGRVLQLAGKPKTDWQVTFRLASRIIDDTLKATPRSARALVYRGLVLTRLGEFEAGTKAVRKALEVSPTDEVVLMNSARVFALQRNGTDEAFTHLGKASHRHFSLPALLDLDFAALRSDQRFQKVLSR